MSPRLLSPTPLEALGAAPRFAVDDATREGARRIIEDVRGQGTAAVRRYAEELDGLKPGAPLILDRAALAAAAERVGPETRALLERTAARIRAFADAQRGALGAIDVPVSGGRAGHDIAPVAAAGCYAPGGRYPLPSSVLMTAVTARTAGVGRVVVASPTPDDVVLAAAYVADADAVLTAGGAQAIGALAAGVPGLLDPVDVIVGPGNRWVTAAKELVQGEVGIDLPAGPSELLVVADHSASAATVAADLLAQAEHDPDARAGVVTLAPGLTDEIEFELERQLADLPTATVARAALERSGYACVVDDWAEVRRAVSRLAPEHLQLCVSDADARRRELDAFGAVFVGERTAEVLGDYGAGPNHVLPTGAAARFTGGLSVLTFLRVRTWLALDAPEAVAADCIALARLEGLEGHARAAERRTRGASVSPSGCFGAPAEELA